MNLYITTCTWHEFDRWHARWRHKGSPSLTQWAMDSFESNKSPFISCNTNFDSCFSCMTSFFSWLWHVQRQNKRCRRPPASKNHFLELVGAFLFSLAHYFSRQYFYRGHIIFMCSHLLLFALFSDFTSWFCGGVVFWSTTGSSPFTMAAHDFGWTCKSIRSLIRDRYDSYTYSIHDDL